MSNAPIQLGTRFMESTRGRVLTLLRRGAQTVDELAQALDMTDNAVRSHLTALERDALIRSAGVRRGPGAGKPAVVYELTPEADVLLSRAYPAVLNAVLEVLSRALPDRVDELLRHTGEHLAVELGGAAAGSLDERVAAAAATLRGLGGEVTVVAGEETLSIEGCGCPLAAAVAERPAVCRAVEALVAVVAGAPAVSACEHGPRPRCRFHLTRAAEPDAA